MVYKHAYAVYDIANEHDGLPNYEWKAYLPEFLLFGKLCLKNRITHAGGDTIFGRSDKIHNSLGSKKNQD